MGTAEGGSEAEKKPRKTPILLHEPIRTGCVCEARDRERECFPDLPDNSLTHTYVYTHTHTCTHLHNTHICTCSCAPTWTHRHTFTHWCALTPRCTHPLTGVHGHRGAHIHSLVCMHTETNTAPFSTERVTFQFHICRRDY